MTLGFDTVTSLIPSLLPITVNSHVTLSLSLSSRTKAFNPKTKVQTKCKTLVRSVVANWDCVVDFAVLMVVIFSEPVRILCWIVDEQKSGWVMSRWNQLPFSCRNTNTLYIPKGNKRSGDTG